MNLMQTDKAKVQTTLFLLLIFLGVMLTAKFTNEGYADYLKRQDQDDLVAIWRDLETKQDNLKEELETLQEQKTALAQEASADSTALTAIRQQLNTLYQINGSAAVKGPGIEITFSGTTPLLYLDLVDIINELWVSGAEGISVNQERVTSLTPFFFTETDAGIYLTANGNIVNYPLVIKALGNSNTLERGLTFPGGIVDNLSTLYNIKPNIIQHAELELPAWKPSSRFGMISDWVGGSRTILPE